MIIINRNQNGFTFIELMISVLIFGIVASGMTGSLIQNRPLNEFSAVKANGSLFAQERLEHYRSLDIASIPSTGSATTSVTQDGTTYTIKASFCPTNLNKCSITTSPCTLSNNARLRQVAIEVNDGSKNLVCISTIIFDYAN